MAGAGEGVTRAVEVSIRIRPLNEKERGRSGKGPAVRPVDGESSTIGIYAEGSEFPTDLYTYGTSRLAPGGKFLNSFRLGFRVLW